jgi:DNA gyrase/topoisomerase IV subunit B
VPHHPRSRGARLYQVGIEHADEAGKIFETLMSDVVELRREFIQDNALKIVVPQEAAAHRPGFLSLRSGA